MRRIQRTYKIKPAGRGNWRASEITTFERISLGTRIEIDGKQYRVIDIVNVVEWDA